MTGPTHVGIGILASVALSRFLEVPLYALAILAVIVGSLMPDIDGGGSISSPGRLFGAFLPSSLRGLLNLSGAIVGRFCRTVFGHRGILHAPIVALALMTIGSILHSPFTIWFGWGYLWHLVADACTMEAVPLFAPFTFRRFGGRFIRTGSVAEACLSIIIWGVVVLYGVGVTPTLSQEMLERISRGH